MKKTVWILGLVWGMIGLNTQTAQADFFSSALGEDTLAWSRTPDYPPQVIQAYPGPEGKSFEERFAKHEYEFGFSLGYGYNINIPPVDAESDERTDLRFAYFFPNFKYNLTGLMGSSIYQGALFWVVEAGAAITTRDPHRLQKPVDDAPNYVFGLVPAQLEYKFLQADRSWAPFLFMGVGVSWGDWFASSNELATAYEFILQMGGGMEYFFSNGTALNFNYRFWHLSNSNIKSPNIGINAHIFSFGVSF